MAGLTPRGEEIGAVVDLLESDEFDSPEDMAKAIYAKVAWVLSMRDTHAVVVHGRYALGPYYSEGEADKMAALLGEFGTTRINLFSPGNTMGKIGPDTGLLWTGFCRCSHPKDMHLADGSSRGKCGYVYSDQCECQKFAEFTPTKKTARKKKAPAAPAGVPEDSAA